MSTNNAESHHAEHVETLLHDAGATHARARKRGRAVIVESGDDSAPHKHLRFRRDTVHLWTVDIADHRGRWESTPFRDTLDAVIAGVIDNFPWVIAPLE